MKPKTVTNISNGVAGNILLFLLFKNFFKSYTLYLINNKSQKLCDMPYKESSPGIELIVVLYMV